METTKVAFITGANRGIGFETAKGLGELGITLVLGVRDLAKGAVAAKKLQTLGYQATAIHYDASQAKSAVDAFEYLNKHYGKLDILVNNAGIQFVAPIDEFPVEKWNTIVNLNLSATFHSVRLALPAMQAADGGKGWGRIINIASVHGLVGSAEKSAYVAAKHGILGLTKVTALENATTGITCNAICPGWVLTPLVQKQVDAKAAAGGISNDAAKEELLGEKEPSMQFTTPEELGALAVFFC